jgi:hypothetical protein
LVDLTVGHQEGISEWLSVPLERVEIDAPSSRTASPKHLNPRVHGPIKSNERTSRTAWGFLDGVLDRSNKVRWSTRQNDEVAKAPSDICPASLAVLDVRQCRQADG